MGGGAASNMGSLFVTLTPGKSAPAKDGGRRNHGKVDAIAARMQEPIVFSVSPPSIPGLGMSAGLEIRLLDINNHGRQNSPKLSPHCREQPRKSLQSGASHRCTRVSCHNTV